MRHLQLLKQDHTQLFRRIDVKILPCHLVNLGFQLYDLFAQLFSIFFQLLSLNAHPSLFHIK